METTSFEPPGTRRRWRTAGALALFSYLCTPSLAWSPTSRLVMSATTGVKRQRHQDNVEGNLFVDTACIDCDACRGLAPSVYSRVSGQTVVTQQPRSEEELREAYRAMIVCPVGSIKTSKGDPLVKAVREEFPIAIDEKELPGVYHLGFHAASTYGCASYFIQGPYGLNLMYDVPRYSNLLASKMEEMGGVHTLVLSHRDDVGEHDKWKERFPELRRVLHVNEVDERTRSVEVKLEGEGPWELPGMPDTDLIFTPGHTNGHVCLLLKRGVGALLSGDHIAKQQDLDQLTGHPDYNWYDKRLQAESILKVAELPFKWILPGHGRRYVFQDAEGEARRSMFQDAAKRLCE